MVKYVLIFFLALMSRDCISQNVFISDKGEVIFYSYALIEDIKATSSQVNSMLNTQTGDIAFMIPMRSFHFEKALMEEHFNEKYIESEKYPQAIFNGKINEKIDVTVNGKFLITAKGKLTIHGVEKEINETGELKIEKDKLTFTTNFYVAIADFNITKPKLLFNNIADTIQVTLNAGYVPFKKK